MKRLIVLALALGCSRRVGPAVEAPPDGGAPADAAPDSPSRLADPIPDQPMPAGLAVTLEEVVAMPLSSPSPDTTDPRLLRSGRINYLGEVPDGSRRLFVPDLNGRLYFIKDRTPSVYLDVAAEIGADFVNNRGLGGGFGFVAFHPDFGSNGIFYTVHTEARDALTTKTPDLTGDAPSQHGVLTEWTAAETSADTFSGTRRELLRIGFRTSIHGIQQIGFNPGALLGDEDHWLLYVAVGDGGGGVTGGDPQDLGKPQGKILRIDPAGRSSANHRYGIPPTNPFVATPGALGEIYAYGLRDPHRFSWDAGPRMFLANIGEHNVESVYDVRPGDNFGWPEREGPFSTGKDTLTCGVYPPPPDAAAFTYPVLAFDHDPPAALPRCVDVGHAVLGGFVYRGARIPALQGEYVFGDVVDGRLFHARASEMRRGSLAPFHTLTLLDAQGQPITMQALVGDARVDLRFGRDDAGELYVLSKASGKIWQVRSARP
jgi:glucose/arabinose dehydrogenase